MSTLLVIKSSIFGESGASSRLTDEFARRWLAANPKGRVVTRDLNAEPVPHLTAERFTAFLTQAEQRTSTQQAVVTYSDGLIAELSEADEVVLAVPMYNFGIPSSLKAYIDHIARAGVTFKYTANGAVGLVPQKKVHVIATRGGFYARMPNDTSAQYLKDFLAFIGLTDVEFIYAEGLAISAEQKAEALARAQEHIDQRFANSSSAQAA